MSLGILRRRRGDKDLWCIGTTQPTAIAYADTDLIAFEIDHIVPLPLPTRICWDDVRL